MLSVYKKLKYVYSQHGIKVSFSDKGSKLVDVNYGMNLKNPISV